MPINIRKIGKSNNLLGKSNLIFDNILKFIFENKIQDKYPLIKAIQFYDDTYLNNLQCVEFATELSMLKSESNMEPSLIQQIDKIIDFVSKVGDLERVHFVGD